MGSAKVETVVVVSSPGDNGTVLLERQVTIEVVPTDPAPTGMYL